ncbi:putative toxin-antitoxin system toxin component, PIN family [Runella salmonicolor]|uniref:Toxin-antitoxin system toxin component, PIN family n=1 Tax=Runella salmonicolor TaxID=2950278 RepID=A0ABT1FYS0_9BACT|nr:putative toxin-antitoxin system toxin component, PIN family [Runella salmonicolor]MCP1385848.1 putative toxin-antitoxin system toxin component, PIN family [Runella salmonicolor]
MPKRKKINVVVDANWYISACINRNSRRTLYYTVLKNTHLQIYYSAELLQEFEGVITRKKFSKIIAPNQIIRFMSLAMLFLKEVPIITKPTLVRDSKDDYLLGICESCNADFLVTGDADLLSLETYNNTTIVTMGQFVNLLNLM